MAGHTAHMVRKRDAYKYLEEKLEGKKPLGRYKYNWCDNIKMDVKYIDLETVGWINMAQNKE
jgi:hypothetical protein